MNWSYLAGFIDGEGSIIIKPPRIRLYISNTHKEVLDEVVKLVKCGGVYEVKRKAPNHWKKQYGWTICNHKDVLRILNKVRNKLIVKKEKCKIALQYIQNKRWQKDYISKKEMEKVKHLSSRNAAKKLGVSPFSILKYRKRFSIST